MGAEGRTTNAEWRGLAIAAIMENIAIYSFDVKLELYRDRPVVSTSIWPHPYAHGPLV